MSEASWLVADIGATNARFALARGPDALGRFALSDIVRLRVADHPTPADAARAFLADVIGKRPRAACFAVAGPVAGETVKLTNAGWSFTRAGLAAALGLDRLALVNDWQAAARGAARAAPAEYRELVSGEGWPGAPILALGPGSGLGMAVHVEGPGDGLTLATEAGHQAFAPASEAEYAVWRRLAAKRGYVACEHVLSGPGLAALHAALCAEAGRPIRARKPAALVHAALTRRAEPPLAREAAELFCAALGGFIGDAVLATGARGAVYLGGGLALALAPILHASDFASRFRKRGVMSAYLAATPIRLLRDSEATALRGAAAFAAAGEGKR